ncbi:MAG: prolyl oligopeptidase family serine peptidase [Deltaproteobacteria bacterium]|nr:prolyl oligopeptidase family serine peptidase [Deltaproteobacteria bacterium]MBN2672509.1 prolyl oligopeptidase family serine peptidase [Deltaproteobacteria bacterium]
MRPHRSLFFFYFIFAVAVTIVSTSLYAADGEDLRLTPGDGGFLSTWLKIGPYTPPQYVSKNEGALETWEPFEQLTAADISLNHRMKNEPVELLIAENSRIGLKPKVESVVYLAAIVESTYERSIWLSTASTDGIQVRLNGTIVHTNSSHSRWVRRDVNLVPLKLHKGDNLLIIKLFKDKPGSWSTYARLMNEEFRRPSDIAVRLPGAGEKLDVVLQTTGGIKLVRQFDVKNRKVVVDAWLQFTGAKPLFGKRTVDVQTDADKNNRFTVMLEGDHPHKTEYLLRRFYFSPDDADDSSIPDKIQVQFSPKVSFTAWVRMKPGHIRRLFAVVAQLAMVRNSELPRSTVESLEWRVEHLQTLLQQGDGGTEYIARELTDTEKMIAVAASGQDPYADKHNQLQRRGYRSSIDGQLHNYALYVPQGWRESDDKQFSLIVALHGLGGHPVKTISTLFGHPMEEEETREERIRFPGPIGRAPMFVVAPMGFGSSGYYTLGERDVLDVIEIVKERYRIDEDRIYITGASMGGTGAAKIPLHYPDMFAASVPLCGYHNLKYYSQVKNRPLLDDEEFAVEVNSNIHWVKNGAHLPLYMVHGTKDFPRQSKDLLEFYQLEGYDAELKLIDAGHNVWDDTYQKGRIFSHFSKYHRNVHPRKIRFRTASLRYRKSHWIEIDGMVHSNQWAEVDAHWQEDNHITVRTQNVNGITIANDRELNSEKTLTVELDGQTLTLQKNEGSHFSFFRNTNQWAVGEQVFSADHKKPGLAGPITDAQNEPLLFVYGTLDPYEGTLARRIISHLKQPRGGMTVDWPVKADAEVTEDDIANYSLVIVGTPTGNKILSRIESRLPIHVANGAIVAGNKQYAGDTVGAAFIAPNPLNPNRYVVVHTGTTRQAIYYSAHLPALLPDYVIYDASTWDEAGGYVLGEHRSVLAEGFFTEEWKLP